MSVVNHAVPAALDINIIRRAVEEGSTCQKLIELLQNNSWNSLNADNLTPEINIAELRTYELLKQELSLTPEADHIIRGNRFVIPTKLRQQVISLAHEGHQGLVKTKKLLREKVWFPKIDPLTEKAVKECLACQSVGQPIKPAPIQPMSIPQHAWDVVYVDFLGPRTISTEMSRTSDRYVVPDINESHILNISPAYFNISVHLILLLTLR